MYSIVIFEGAISLLIVAWIAVLEELALVNRTLKKLRIVTMLYKINVHDWKQLVDDNRGNIDNLRHFIEHEKIMLDEAESYMSYLRLGERINEII